MLAHLSNSSTSPTHFCDSSVCSVWGKPKNNISSCVPTETTHAEDQQVTEIHLHSFILHLNNKIPNIQNISKKAILHLECEPETFVWKSQKLGFHWETCSKFKKSHNVQFSNLRKSRAPSVPQQHIYGSFSGILLLVTLKELLYVGEFTAEGLFCLLSLAPIETTMSSTASCWIGASSWLWSSLFVLGGLLADVSKNDMLWALAKLRARSWLTW